MNDLDYMAMEVLRLALNMGFAVGSVIVRCGHREGVCSNPAGPVGPAIRLNVSDVEVADNASGHPKHVRELLRDRLLAELNPCAVGM